MPDVKIKYVSWRAGRPRFSPGPGLRALGYEPQDLKHEDGRWFTQGEAVDWSNEFARRKKLQDEYAASPSASAPAKPGTAAPETRPASPVVVKPKGTYPISRLFEDWLVSPRVQSKAPATIKDYRQKSRVIESHDPDLWASEVRSLDQTICYGLYEELWQERGIATAHGTLGVLAMAIKWGMRTGRVKGLPYNPARDLDMERPKPRARFITPQEFNALIRAAEKEGRVDLADMLYCGVWTGQRQADRLALQKAAIRGGRFVVRQQKTGAIVNPPVAPAYQKRIDDADRRRKQKGIVSPFVHLNEATWEQWNHYTYRNLFAEIRAKAAEKRPSCKTIMEKDLRATAVTWMALAGNTLPQICAVSGHSLTGAHQILKHYLALHPDMASSAIGNLITWYESGASIEMAV